MSRRERNKQKKKRRQERLRQDKHIRQSQPVEREDDGDDDLDDLDELPSSEDELLALLEVTMAAAADTLGPRFFAQNKGRFWGIPETRDYMIIRGRMADLFRRRGRLPEAIGHYEALLELCAHDNPGNRDPLLGCYLTAGNLEGARRLLKDYAPGLAVFAWGRVLERYLTGDLAGATSALAEARAQNRHVEAFLTGARRAPTEPLSSYTVGEESEAAHVADCLLSAWRKRPDAVAWLKTGQPPAGPGPREGQPASGPPAAPLDNFFLAEPARQWLHQLLSGTDADPIVRALDPADFLPADRLLRSVCCEMLVAAELIAAGIGRPSRHLPPRAAAWLVERDMLFTPGVVMLAATAVRRVGEFSELRQIMDTEGAGQEWLRGVEALHSRLQR